MLESFSTDEVSPSLLHEVEEFLDTQSTAHPFQFPRWSDPRGKLLLLRTAGKICWSGLFSVYRPVGRKAPWIRAAQANRGPVCDDSALFEDAAAHLPEAFHRNLVCYVEISPERVPDSRGKLIEDPGWTSARTHRVSLRLDLTANEDLLFANLRKNSRYEIRRAERTGVALKEASTDGEIEEFLGAHRKLAARKGFPPEEFDRMRRQIQWVVNSESRGALLLAHHDNSVRGGVVIVRAARRCWYVWGATQTQPNVSVGQILQWEAIRWAKRHGCTEYDFGGYTPGATSGPAWFKAGFGGAEVHFAPAARKILKPVQYRAMNLLLRTEASSD
jgi:hypothetical protein